MALERLMTNADSVIVTQKQEDRVTAKNTIKDHVYVHIYLK